MLLCSIDSAYPYFYVVIGVKPLKDQGRIDRSVTLVNASWLMAEALALSATK